jgi:hypothetical protein
MSRLSIPLESTQLAATPSITPCTRASPPTLRAPTVTEPGGRAADARTQPTISLRRGFDRAALELWSAPTCLHRESRRRRNPLFRLLRLALTIRSCQLKRLHDHVECRLQISVFPDPDNPPPGGG